MILRWSFHAQDLAELQTEGQGHHVASFGQYVIQRVAVEVRVDGSIKTGAVEQVVHLESQAGIFSQIGFRLVPQIEVGDGVPAEIQRRP